MADLDVPRDRVDQVVVVVLVVPPDRVDQVDFVRAAPVAEALVRVALAPLAAVAAEDLVGPVALVVDPELLVLIVVHGADLSKRTAHARTAKFEFLKCA